MDKLKELFQGKKGKFMIAGVVLVVILGVVALRNKNGNRSAGVGLAEYPTYQSNALSGTSDAEMQSQITDLSRDMQTALKDQTEQSKKLTEQYNNSLSMTQSAFSNMFMGLQNQITDLSGVNQALQSQLLASAQSKQEELLVSAQKKIATASVSPVVVDSKNTTVYSSSNVYSGTKETMPVYGYGGVDYNQTDKAGKVAMREDLTKVRNDADYRASELARANQVIAERKKAGLDTKEQDAYKKHLTSLGA